MKFNLFDIATFIIAFLAFIFSSSFKRFKKFLKKNKEEIQKAFIWFWIWYSRFSYAILILSGLLCSLYAIVTERPLYLVLIIFVGFWAGAEYFRALPKLLKIA